jgi:hypothetical protein
MTACNKDLGNYDYEDVNTVVIGESREDNGKVKRGIDNKTSEVGVDLAVRPLIDFSAGEDESLFTYTWYYWNTKDSKWYVLHEGRNLEIKVAGPIGAPDTDYRLAYEIVNKKTQIPYRELFNLKVNNPLTRGILALCETQDGFDIDQLALSGEGVFTFHKNVLDEVGSSLSRKGVKPYDIVAYMDNLAPTPYDREGETFAINILTDRYTTRILAKDYSWKPSYDISNFVENGSYLDNEYKKKGKPIICEQMKYAYLNSGGNIRFRTIVYVKDENGKGNWFFYADSPLLLFFSNAMNKMRETEPNPLVSFDPAPFASLESNGAMYYDMQQKEFKYQGLTSSLSAKSSDLYYSKAISPEEDKSGYFQYNASNEGILYMGEVLGAIYPSANYAITRQSDGSFRYIEYQFPTSGGLPLKQGAAIFFAASSNIGNAKFFARYPSSTNPYLYYVTNDNRIYKADVSNTPAVVTEITSDVLPGDGYTEVTAFKYLLPNSNALSKSISGYDVDKALAVATYNPSLGKNTGGKLEFFKQDGADTGKLVRTRFPNKDVEEGEYQIDMSWTGLGRVVGLTYKDK